MRSRMTWLFAAGLLCLAPASAFAVDWPMRPVRIIAPATPGGAADTFGRLVAEHLSEMFKERFYVENRAGAGGLIGAVATARAEPDGYTFMTSSIAYQVLAPAVSANPGFDPIKDFTHVAYIGGPPNVLVASPGLGVRTFKEFLTRAHRDPPLAYVSPGVGTLGHLVGERLAQQAGIKLVHIPHKGASQAMMDILGGNVPLGTMTWTSALGQIRGNKVIPLALTSDKRVAEYPDVPTYKELGYPALVAKTWFAISGPAGIPKEIVEKLNRAIVQILALPEVKARLDRDAVETQAMTPEEFTKFMESEIATWAPFAKKVMQSK